MISCKWFFKNNIFDSFFLQPKKLSRRGLVKVVLQLKQGKVVNLVVESAKKVVSAPRRNLRSMAWMCFIAKRCLAQFIPTARNSRQLQDALIYNLCELVCREASLFMRKLHQTEYLHLSMQRASLLSFRYCLVGIHTLIYWISLCWRYPIRFTWTPYVISFWDTWSSSKIEDTRKV